MPGWPTIAVEARSASPKRPRVFSVMALIAGVIVGPRLPGASAEEMVSFRDTGDPTRIVVSPYRRHREPARATDRQKAFHRQR